MKRFHFQVACTDAKGYILEYRNFRFSELPGMKRYIENKATEENVNRIEITRWNEKGERE